MTHQADGSGYRLLGEFIAKMDSINPMVAARLTKALMSFKHYTEPYASLMRAEMVTLQTLPGLSSDLTEIINQSVAS